MIKYKSTRGNKTIYSFSEALLKGIAEDGGLFVPEKIPRFTLKQLELLSKKSYQERALFILNLFQIDSSKKTIKEIINKAYSSNFDSSNISPLVHLKDNQYILELWHGPTSAFKDMALQIMPLLFSEAVKNKPLRYFILVATSGDTGKAALEGYKDKENISIMVLYPYGHVSQLQELQMITQEGSNVNVFAIDGNFDTVQTLVKDIFNDKEFNKNLLGQHKIILSSANSINWGRLVPQIIYHVSSYADLIEKGVISAGEQIDVAVPTGNFGNILAAFYAKKMGLPIRRFVCASNANNVIAEFLQTGIYDIKKRALVQTPSPSMDILIASNIERLLYEITQNSKKVSLWMNELKTDGKFEVDDSTKSILKNEFYSDWVSNKDCLSNIKRLYDETKYLVDPHTSVAQVVAERYIKQESVSLPIIISSTAHWAKFAKDVYKALNNSNKTFFSDEFEILKAIKKSFPEVSIPKSISALKNKKKRHYKKYSADKRLIENLII